MKRKIINIYVIKQHVLLLTSIDDKINTFIELPYKGDIYESLEFFQKTSIYSELEEDGKIKLDELCKISLTTPEKYRLIYHNSSGINLRIEDELNKFSNRYTDSFEEDVDEFKLLNIEINKIIDISDNEKLSAIIIDDLLYIDEKLFNNDFYLINSVFTDN